MSLKNSNKVVSCASRILATTAAVSVSTLLALQLFIPTHSVANAFYATEPNNPDWTTSENLITSTDESGNVIFNKTVLDQIAKAGGWDKVENMIAAVQNSNTTYDASQFMTNPDTQKPISNGIRIAMGTYQDNKDNTQPMYWTPVYLTTNSQGHAVLDLWLCDSTNFSQSYYAYWYAYFSLEAVYPCNLYSTSYVRSYLNGTQYTCGYSLWKGDPGQPGLIYYPPDPDNPDDHGVITYMELNQLEQLLYSGDISVDSSEDSESSSTYLSEFLTEYDEEGNEIEYHSLSSLLANHVYLTTEEDGHKNQSEDWKSFLQQMGYNADTGKCDYICKPSEMSYQRTERITDCPALADNQAYNDGEGNKTYYLYVNDAYGKVSGDWETLSWSKNPETGEYDIPCDTNDFSNYDRYGDWQNDYLWIPSFTEMGDSGFAGIWNLSDAQLSNRCLTRSGARDCWVIDGGSTEETSYYDNAHPAIHLDLGTVTASSQDSPTGTITGITYTPPTDTSVPNTASSGTSSGGTSNTSGGTSTSNNIIEGSEENPVEISVYDTANTADGSEEEKVPVAVIVVAVAVPVSIVLFAISIIRFFRFRRR